MISRSHRTGQTTHGHDHHVAMLHALPEGASYRVAWSYDEDHEPWGDIDLDYERMMLDSGEWVAEGCMVVVTGPACPHCDCRPTGRASLWGVVSSQDLDGAHHRRRVELEVLREALAELGEVGR